MACAICEIRRPRRYCPGVRGDICTICCGTEREVTVSCPLDCPHLQAARQHERVAQADPDQFPNRDIRVTDQFIGEHEALLVFTARNLLSAALEVPGAVDTDVREALDALIRTHRTLQSGVYYETRPVNGLANHIYGLLQAALAEFRRGEAERTGMQRTRDADVLGVLVFLQRLELDRNNGRPRGRAFLDFLRGFFADSASPAAAPSSLIVP
jgi:hypothetical protein